MRYETILLVHVRDIALHLLQPMHNPESASSPIGNPGRVAREGLFHFDQPQKKAMRIAAACSEGKREHPSIRVAAACRKANCSSVSKAAVSAFEFTIAFAVEVKLTGADNHMHESNVTIPAP